MRTDERTCPFCQIVNGGDGTVLEVWRDASTVAFFPDHPATPGHTLVIPREHAETIDDLRMATMDELFHRVVALAPTIAAAVGAEGFNLIQSNGVAAEQTVPHVHVHVLPRWSSDQMGAIWPESADLPRALVDEAWHRVKNATSDLR